MSQKRTRAFAARLARPYAPEIQAQLDPHHAAARPRLLLSGWMRATGPRAWENCRAPAACSIGVRVALRRKNAEFRHRPHLRRRNGFANTEWGVGIVATFWAEGHAHCERPDPRHTCLIRRRWRRAGRTAGFRR